MFALTDIKEYWCIVCINEHRDDARIMRESDDVKQDFETLDYDLDRVDHIRWPNWQKEKPGVYKLILEFVHDDQEDRDFDDHLQIVAVEVICEL